MTNVRRETAKSFINIFFCQALHSSKDAMQNEFQPKLLDGEIEAARAKNVSLYIAQKKKTVKGQKIPQDKLGTLIITNFRLSFTLFDGANTAVSYIYYFSPLYLSFFYLIYRMSHIKKTTF